MREVDWLRFLGICFVLSAAVFALDVVFHAWAVPGLYEGYPQRAPQEIAKLLPFLFVTYVAQITIFCLLFLCVYPARGMMNAIAWGLWGGLFVVFPNMQFFVGVAGTTWTLLAVQVVEAIVLLVLATAIFELGYRPRGIRLRQPAAG